MSDQEGLAHLEAENATLRQYLAEALDTIACLQQRIAELGGSKPKIATTVAIRHPAMGWRGGDGGAVGLVVRRLAAS